MEAPAQKKRPFSKTEPKKPRSAGEPEPKKPRVGESSKAPSSVSHPSSKKHSGTYYKERTTEELFWTADPSLLSVVLRMAALLKQPKDTIPEPSVKIKTVMKAIKVLDGSNPVFSAEPKPAEPLRTSVLAPELTRWADSSEKLQATIANFAHPNDLAQWTAVSEYATAPDSKNARVDTVLYLRSFNSEYAIPAVVIESTLGKPLEKLSQTGLYLTNLHGLPCWKTRFFAMLGISLGLTSRYEAVGFAHFGGPDAKHRPVPLFYLAITDAKDLSRLFSIIELFADAFIRRQVKVEGKEEGRYVCEMPDPESKAAAIDEKKGKGWVAGGSITRMYKVLKSPKEVENALAFRLLPDLRVEYEYEEKSLVLISYAKLAGEHLPPTIGHLSALLRWAHDELHVHDLVHCDILLRNCLFHTIEGKPAARLIDFDYLTEVKMFLRFTPREDIKDGGRHDEMKFGYPVRIEHDVFALGAIISLFRVNTQPSSSSSSPSSSSVSTAPTISSSTSATSFSESEVNQALSDASSKLQTTATQTQLLPSPAATDVLLEVAEALDKYSDVTIAASEEVVALF